MITVQQLFDARGGLDEHYCELCQEPLVEGEVDVCKGCEDDR